MSALDFHLRLSAGDSEYDFVPLRERISESRYAFRHPQSGDETYVVAPHPDTARRLEIGLQEGRSSGYSASALVTLQPRCISVYFEVADPQAREQVGALLIPFLKPYDFSIIGDEFGIDATEEYSDRLDDLF